MSSSPSLFREPKTYIPKSGAMRFQISKKMHLRIKGEMIELAGKDRLTIFLRNPIRSSLNGQTSFSDRQCAI
jgi:hypothetical protein